MDIDRFNKIQSDLDAKRKADKEWTAAFCDNTTKYWLGYIFNVIDHISDSYLDDVIANKLCKANSTIDLCQRIYYPCMSSYTYNQKQMSRIFYNKNGDNDVYSSDLWKNKELQYSFNGYNILVEQVENTSTEYIRGYLSGDICMSSDARNKYAKLIESRICTRLINYGLSIKSINHDCDLVTITVKNPVAH